MSNAETHTHRCIYLSLLPFAFNPSSIHFEAFPISSRPYLRPWIGVSKKNSPELHANRRVKISATLSGESVRKETAFTRQLFNEVMAGRASGTPLLTIGDMLRDLSERPVLSALAEPDEPDSPNTIKAKKIEFLESFLHPDGLSPKDETRTPPPKPYFKGQNLVEAFEMTYKDLQKALAEDNDMWPQLTEQLSAALTTANKLISTANQQKGPLLDEIRRLQTQVDRGQAALEKLQTSIG